MRVSVIMRLVATLVVAAGLGASAADAASVGVNFFASNGATSIADFDFAGVEPQLNWNNAVFGSDPQAGTTANILGPIAGSVVDDAGVPVPGLNITWASATTWNSGNGGTPDKQLMDGYIDNNGTFPTTFTRVTGIPYAHYKVIGYMGSDGNGRTGTMAISNGPSVAFSTNSAPFNAFVPNSNYVEFSGMSSSTFTLMNYRGSNNSGIHGLQIVELPGPAPAAANPATLKAYYSFDDASNVMRDYNLGLNSGTAQDNATQGPGMFGIGSLQLDGAGDHGLVGTTTVDIRPTSSLAVSVWVNRQETDSGEIVSLGDHYGLRLNGDGTVHFFEDTTSSGDGWSGLTTRAGIASEMIANDGLWHHIVAQKTPNSMEIYIDGVAARGINAAIYETRPIDYAGLGNTSLFVGRHGNGSTGIDFRGMVDELRIFEGVLSYDEVQNLYRNNAVPEPSSFVLAGLAALGLIPTARRVRRMA